VSEGQRLFEAFNCVGCHAHDGGGIGPALMDAKWIYGGDPAEVYGSIMYGRPNGMPAFNGRIRESEAWEIAALRAKPCRITAESGRAGQRR